MVFSFAVHLALLKLMFNFPFGPCFVWVALRACTCVCVWACICVFIWRNTYKLYALMLGATLVNEPHSSRWIYEQEKIPLDHLPRSYTAGVCVYVCVVVHARIDAVFLIEIWIRHRLQLPQVFVIPLSLRQVSVFQRTCWSYSQCSSPYICTVGKSSLHCYFSHFLAHL